MRKENPKAVESAQFADIGSCTILQKSTASYLVELVGQPKIQTCAHIRPPFEYTAQRTCEQPHSSRIETMEILHLPREVGPTEFPRYLVTQIWL